MRAGVHERITVHMCVFTHEQAHMHAFKFVPICVGGGGWGGESMSVSLELKLNCVNKN